MGKISRYFSRLIPVVFLVFTLGCGEDEAPVASFDITEIVGDYTAQLKMDFSGPRPEVSVFGGSLNVTLINAQQFTLSIDFPDDYITTELTGTVVDKIVNSGNSRLGGINFEVAETSELMANVDKLEVTTNTGEIKKAYGIFLESAGGLSMVLHMIEKEESPTEFEFKAVKSE